jgi:hypothetical protein
MNSRGGDLIESEKKAGRSWLLDIVGSGICEHPTNLQAVWIYGIQRYFQFPFKWLDDQLSGSDLFCYLI